MLRHGIIVAIAAFVFNLCAATPSYAPFRYWDKTAPATKPKRSKTLTPVKIPKRAKVPKSYKQNTTDCDLSPKYPNQAIRGCTALIEAGRDSGQVLSAIYYKRATAYFKRGQYDRAAADYRKARSLDPSFKILPSTQARKDGTRGFPAPANSEIPAPAVTGGITYTLIEEKIYEAPVKTQVIQRIAFSGIPTKDQLEAEILKRYRAIKIRSGFRYHRHPTAIYIFVYASEEHARNASGTSIGSMQKHGADTEDPPVRIDQDRLDALSKKARVRFGLSENKRKEFYSELIATEDRSLCEAMARFPDPQLMKQINFHDGLFEKYKKELILKYGITSDQLVEILFEASKAGWLYPKTFYPKCN